MRVARKLALLVVSAAALMALIAPVASATEPITVTNEAGTANCPAVNKNPANDHDITGGCLIHAEGEATMFFHIFGIESTEATCRVEFEGRVGGNGEGYVMSQLVTPHPNDAGCDDSTAEPCSEAEHPNATEFPWHGTSEEINNGVVKAHYDICIEPAEVVSECQGEYITTVTETGDPAPGMEVQHQEATDIRIGASSLCEISISVNSEVDATHVGTHIRHQLLTEASCSKRGGRLGAPLVFPPVVP